MKFKTKEKKKYIYIHTWCVYVCKSMLVYVHMVWWRRAHKFS